MSEPRKPFYKPNPNDRLTKEQDAANEALIRQHEQKEKPCPTNSNSSNHKA